MPWQELLPDLDHSIKVDKAGQHIFLVIILLVVALGVTNTMMMAVFERTREFGLLAALGTTPSEITSTTLWEAAWVSLLGAVLGVALGALLNINVPINMPGEGFDFAGMTLDRIQPINNFRGNVLYPLIIFVSGVLAGILPALRAARLAPAQALRQF